MTEPIPFWEDWEFWRVIVTGLFALIGFFLAAWAKYGFDLRLDARRRDQDKAVRDEEKAVMAIALRAELLVLMEAVVIRIGRAKNLQASTDPVIKAQLFPLDLAPATVFESNTGRLGDLGRLAALNVIKAQGQANHIRINIAGARDRAPDNPVSASDLEGALDDFRILFERTAEAINALDAFLGEPASYRDPKGELKMREVYSELVSESQASAK